MTLPYSFGTGTNLDKLFISQLQADLDALVVGAPNTQIVNYILAATDGGQTIAMNLAGANTLTVPPNVTIPMSVGSYFWAVQLGAGQTTLTQGIGVTINSRIGLKLAGHYAVARVYQYAANLWVASGDLTV